MTTDILFDHIAHDSVSDMAVAQIEDMIVQGILVEGSRLPSERDLAERLRISRPKVRDALKTLEQAGLVIVRHGEGTFIAPLTGQAMSPALLDLYARHGTAFFDYLEYRREQEGVAARLAARRATTTDKDEIRSWIARMEEAHAAGDADASKEADVAFHASLVNASHNVMLIHMMKSIYELTRRGVFYNRAVLRTLDGTGEKLLAQHTAIAEAVLDGDEIRAEQAAHAHLDFVEASFRAGRERDLREKHAGKRRLAAKL